MIFSIITPSFNQGKYISQTIESVLSQAGNFFIEYIIADGGSTDNSVEVIKHYEKLLKNGQFPVACNGIEYRWWSHKDYGQSNAINSGLAVARGDVLAWLNSDDYYEDGALKKVATFFDLHPGFDLLYGSGFMVDEPGLKKVQRIIILLISMNLEWAEEVFSNPLPFFLKILLKWSAA